MWFAGVGPTDSVRPDSSYLQRRRREFAEPGRADDRENFQRRDHTWDDPAIKALNVDAALPSTPIHVFFRSDQSANTSNFEKYLDAASNGAWGKGSSQTFLGGVGDGAAGDDGTSGAVQNTDGSITYNEWSFAVGKQLNIAQIITSAGPEPVTITTDSVAKTIAGAKFVGQGNDLVVDTSSFYKPTQAGAYPIVEPTYEVVFEVSGLGDRYGGKSVYAGRNWRGPK